MRTRYALLLATAPAFVGSATAAPVMPFAPAAVLQAVDTAVRPDESGLILVQNRGGGAGGGRAAAGGGRQNSARSANRGGNFNSNDFHRDVSNSRSANVNANRNTTVNANRNVNVSGGGCCYGNYDDGPSWGGVAAGVAVGAVVGAAASSAAQSNTYVAPPPTYPPGYVAPPPY
jgi:hypothetical protein